jgi:hypothetical protein
MKPINLDVVDIRYRRPGLNKFDFVATYPEYYRRGTVVYDTIKQQFLTHNGDLELLLELCLSLQRPIKTKSQ